MFLKVSQTSQESAYILESLFKNSQIEGFQLYLKKTPTQVFSCEVCKILRTPFFQRTPLMTVSASPLADSVFFLNQTALSQSCDGVLNFFFFTYRLMYKKSISFV